VEVQAAQLCGDRAPSAAACDYALAIALGQQARERHATGRDGLAKMVAALRRAIASEPRLDGAGPHRVLALVYLRAPGWPAGPGDTEAGLLEAREAVILVPEHPANQLALAEALRRNGRPDEARAAYRHALELARGAAGDPDAPEWLAEATKGLGPA
jgi:tetratricopeptide (TPR) repeat protein